MSGMKGAGLGRGLKVLHQNQTLISIQNVIKNITGGHIKMQKPYKRNGFELPHVTQIISDCTDKSAPLTQWAANQTTEWIKENCSHFPGDNTEPGYWEVTAEDLDNARFHFRDVSKKALDIGSEVHDMIEAFFKTDRIATVKIVPKEAKNAFDAFLFWVKENDIKPLQIEQTVYGDYWGGKLDFYGYFNGKLYVIDWKSSKAHYPEMRYQVAAYRWAIGEYEDPRVDGCGVLRLDKETGMPDWKDHSKTYESDLRRFNKMADLYFERHPIIRKKAGKEVI